MTPIEILGYAAAFLTTASFIPQAILVIRTRRTGGISLLMYSMFVVGVALWLIYGIVTGAAPLIAANGITLVLAGTILVIAMKERWGRRGTLKAREPGGGADGRAEPGYKGDIKNAPQSRRMRRVFYLVAVAIRCSNSPA